MSSLEKNGKWAKQRWGAITQGQPNSFFKQSIQLKKHLSEAYQSFIKQLSNQRPFDVSFNGNQCKKILIFAFLSFITIPFVNGQVQFKVELLSDHETYQVSMLPSVTWNNPDNITSTAQITLRVPTGGFSVNNVTSLVQGTFWANNAQYIAPMEAPNYDYISFGLTSLGTPNFTYQEGVELPLFTFTNVGLCTGPLEIITSNDPFLPPNSLNANVTNQIATIGGGASVNVFSGIYGAGSADCTLDLTCLTQYELSQLADGSYTVSMVVDTAWNAPLNETKELMVTLVAPAGSLSIADFESIQTGAPIECTDAYLSPAENPNFDYFVFELTDNNTTSLSYQRGLYVPLFRFKNGGSCSGDSLSIMDNATDPFAMPNLQNATVGQFLRTTGSDFLLEPCPIGQSQPLAPQISNVVTADLTDCDSDNGTITIETDSYAALEYSIDSGMTWQENHNFSLLTAGEYHVFIRYVNEGCPMAYAQNPVIIEQPQAPTINNIFANDPTGCGVENGSISISATSAISPEFSIDNGNTWQISNIFSDLPAGTYPVMVRNGTLTCPVTGDTIFLEFNGPTSPTIDSVSTTNLTSCTALNGIIRFHVADTVDLEYSIDNGATWSANPNYTDLSAGTYFLQSRNEATNCVSVHSENPVQISAQGCDDCIAEYVLELLADGRFQVSVIPHITWTYPHNITSTAQVTIIVPTGAFEVEELTNLIPGVVFNDNSTVISPPENPDYDYISFGLETLGTTNIPYQDGVKVPLFTFKNSVPCTGSIIKLMDKAGDPFAFPNSQLINVGPQLTTTGSGQDGTVCIQYPGIAPCIPRVEASNDTVNVFINTTAFTNVLTNDTSYLDNPMTASLFPGSTTDLGTMTISGDGTVAYTPNPNAMGIDTVQYIVCEDAHPGTCDIGVITFIISDANELEAVTDDYQTQVNTAIFGDLTLNDINAFGHDLITELAVAPSNGTVMVNSDGTFTYTPNLNFVGFDTYLYKVCDDGFPTVCDFGTVNIQVMGSTDLLAIDDSFIGSLNTVLNGNVANNDFNPDGGPTEVNIIPNSGPTDGTLTLNTDGSFQFTPDNGYVGINEFSYLICETTGNLHCDTGLVQINIPAEINATDDSFDLDVNTVVNGQVLPNDFFPGSINVLAMSIQDVSNGTLNFGVDGGFTYTPNFGFVGQDFFTYQICNTGIPLVCDTAIVSLNVISQIEAIDNYFILNINTSTTDNVLQNDLIGGGINTTATILDDVENGTLIFNPNGDFSYTPNLGFAGIDTLIYELCDNGMPQTCDTATVLFEVVSDLMALDDQFEVDRNGGIIRNVSLNDLIPNGVNGTVTLVDGADNGILILMGDGEFIYMPDPDYVGDDSFIYQICDGNIPPNCDTATVFISVNEKLVAVSDSFDVNINGYVSESVITNDTIPNIGQHTVTLLNDVNAGVLNLNLDGGFYYTPNTNFLGVDFFDYILCENSNCDTARVTLFVTTKLLAVDDFEFTESGLPFLGDVTDNDIFGPGVGVVTASVLPTGGPDNGTVTMNPDGTYSYEPNADFMGTDMFQYVICNDEMPPICDTATVVFLVFPDALTAVNDTFEIQKNTILNGSLIDNDINPGMGTMLVNNTPITPPSIGQTILNTDGTFIYIPPADYVGPVVFQYEVCTNQIPIGCDTATVFIDVYGIDNPAIICSDAVCEQENIVLTLQQSYSNQATYEWYNGNNVLIGNNAILAIGAGDANAISPFRVRVTDNGITTALSAPCSVPVITMPPVFATNNGPVCDNQSVQLGATQVDNATYEWRILGNPDVISVAQNPTFDNIDNTTTYEVTVRLVDCGMTTTATTTVEFSPTPTLDPQATYSMGIDCKPSDLQFIANAVGTGLTYSWASPNGIFSTAENPSIPQANSSFNGSYALTVTNEAGCSATEYFSVNNIVDFVNEPIITSSGPACEGEKIELNTQLYNGFDVNYAWVHDGAIMIGNSSNQLILQPVDVSQVGMYQVLVQVDDCFTESDEFEVEILQKPEVQPTRDSTSDCTGEPIQLFANPSDFGTDATFNWVGPNGFHATAENPFIQNPTPDIHAGVYAVEITAANGCKNTGEVELDSILVKPATPQLEAANNALCVGETLELNASFYTGQSISYQWYLDDGTSISLLGVTSAPSFFVNNLEGTDAGIYSVIVEVDGCESDISNLENVTILGTGSSLSPTNSTTISNPACEGDSIYLNVPVIAGATYNWTGPAGFDSDLPNPVIVNASSNQAGGYFVEIEKDGCSVISDTTMVMIAPKPLQPYLNMENELCLGDSLTLQVLNPQLGATYHFYHATTNNLIQSTNNNTLTLYDIDEDQAGEYYVLMNLDGCTSDASDMENIEVQTPPNNIAFAGQDLGFCEEIDIVELNALPPSVGYGEWHSLNPNVSIFNQNIANTQVGNLDSLTTLVWSLSYEACRDYSSDTVTIQLASIPDEAAFAGEDIQICSEDEPITLTLDAELNGIAEGIWSQPADQSALGATIIQPIDPDTKVQGLVPGQVYTFTWSLSSGICEDFSSDEIEVTVTKTPDQVAFIEMPEMNPMCNELIYDLDAEPPTIGEGLWSTTSGATIINPNASSTNIQNLEVGANEVIWSLSHEGCENYSSDTITIFNESVLAEDDSYGAFTNDTMIFDVTLNDSIFLSDWELRLITEPRQGTITLNDDGTVSYIAFQGSGGGDEFRYMVCSKSCPSICDMATVKLIIIGNDTSDIFIPNTISPNDDGLNDAFIIPAVVEHPQSQITIFNRWGSEVYHSDNYQNDWQGTFNGDYLPEGTYFYCLVLNDSQKTVQRGYVTIRRE
jgi:gliding motility-associated-like protein